MEEEICQFSKFGFCWYENECKKNTSPVNLNILMNATPKKAVQKGTQIGADNMILNIVVLKVIVHTNILRKHEHHQCKECEEKLSNFMQLIKHTAQHNTKNQSVLKPCNRIRRK